MKVTKICKVCLQSKRLNCFNGTGKKYLKNTCKSCEAEKNKDRLRTLRSTDEYKEYHRDYKLRTRFGITSEQYDQMFSEQNGLCYLCRKPSKQTLAVDHSHQTKTIRKLLCFHCNTVLGHIKENKNLLRRMIEYLETYA